jgi:putative two-component system response regulator
MYISAPFEPATAASKADLNRQGSKGERLDTPTGVAASAPVARDAQLERVVADLRLLLAERERHLEGLALAHQETLLRLALAAESRDGETGVHIVRLGQIAGLLALSLTGNRPYASLLCQAAPMHDIGKIGIPDSVLKKPDRLDAAEWEIMRQHPVIGARILGRSRHPLFKLAASVALNHHERFDGDGYPSGLKGAAIPLGARIVAVADVYDALTMDRVYRARLPHTEVCRMVSDQQGKHFDPEVVSAFLADSSRIDELRQRVNLRFEHRSLEQEGTEAFRPMF